MKPDKMTAEVKRLRAALREIASGDCPSHLSVQSWLRGVAARALHGAARHSIDCRLLNTTEGVCDCTSHDEAP